MSSLLESAQRGRLSQEARKNLEKWLTDPLLVEFVPAIEQLLKAGQWPEIEDAFYTHITVGTGGVRGPLGVGPNRVNGRTIGEAAQGLSEFIRDFGAEAMDKGVVVGYEVRRQAREFADLSAEVFAANGIKVFLFDHLCATPEVSFAVRYLKTTAGVMITASHNPRTDNGFKFYWSDGGQVVPPHDAKFMDLVNQVTVVHRLNLLKAKRSGLIKTVESSVDQAYRQAIRDLSLAKSRSAKIVFSPLHGAGSTNVLPVLQAEKFNVVVVPEQAALDENFPTAPSDLINPEYPQVMEMAIDCGTRSDADVVLVSDPDADRVGVASKITAGQRAMRQLTGDEVGATLVHFILSELKAQGRLPLNGLVIETYVTTSLIADIARSFGAAAIDDLLVGFKFIAEIIEKLDNKKDFIFAAEQSLGYLVGTFVRDKDAAIASLMVAELVAKLKDEGRTAIEYLDDIYCEYGYYHNSLKNVEFKGRAGRESMAVIMKGLRFSPPKTLGGHRVVKIIDRLKPELRDPVIYQIGKTGDQLTFVLSEDERTRVTVRPSGTEPTIKYYVQHYRLADSDDLSRVKSAVDTEAQSMTKDIVSAGAEFIKNSV